MPLDKAASWTDLYYGVIEHYFWSPQHIGRVSDKSKPGHHWDYWKGKLEQQETPLNHIINFLFHVAPDDLLDRIASSLLSQEISGLQLMAVPRSLVDRNIVQPDIVLSNGQHLIFIELKVDSQSSVDQFAKYAIAAHCITQDEPQLKKVDLLVIGRQPAYSRVWARAKAINVTDLETLRRAAIRGMDGHAGIWSQKGVQKYLKSEPAAKPAIVKMVKSIGLTLADYGPMRAVLGEYARTEKSVGRLIDGLLLELARRGL